MKKVTKALIPAAGLGTRFLPATKTVPKEMLTIVDQPILLYVVEEAVRSGITDIVLVAGRNKHAIEDFFDVSYELEDQLTKSGKTELLERITRLKDMANIISIRQKQALGLGHAVYTGQPILGSDEAFAVLLGDEIMIANEDTPQCTEELIKLYQDQGCSSVAVMEVPEQDVKKYGIIKHEPLGDDSFTVKSVVEKPAVEDAPSRLALPGRYVFTSKIMDALRETKPGKNGEIQLTDAMCEVAKAEGMVATTFKARRYDAGDKLGYLQANIELALERPDLGPDLKSYLKSLDL